MYLEHSVESLAQGGPWQLGTVLQGNCGWRTLSEAETATYGGSTLRRLYGCAIRMVKPAAHAPAGSRPVDDVRPTAESCSGEMFEQQLLTWSQVCANVSAAVLCILCRKNDGQHACSDAYTLKMRTAAMTKSLAQSARRLTIKHAGADSAYSFLFCPQDDFDDLCEALMDRLGPTSPTHLLSAHQLSPTDSHSRSHSPTTPAAAGKNANTANAACVAQAVPAANKTLLASPSLSPARPPQPTDADSGHSLTGSAAPCSAADAADTACAAQEPQAVPSAKTLAPPTPAPAADLAKLAAELQALAEETGRLRQGLDRLVALTEAASSRRPSPSPAGHGWPAREGDFVRTGACSRPLGAAAGAGEAGGRALWLQERLLGAVEALLEEVRAGGFLPGSAGGPVGGFRHQSPAYGKKARAMAAAQAAQAAQAAHTAAYGDMMELTPRHDDDDDAPQESGRPSAAGADQAVAGVWAGPGTAAGLDSDAAAAGRDAAALGTCGPEAAPGGPSSGGGLGGVWHRELVGGDVGAGGGWSVASTPAPRFSSRQNCASAHQPFAATLQHSGSSVPPGHSAWSAPATPRQQHTAFHAPALTAQGAIRLYDDPAGPAVPASGSDHDGGSRSHPSWGALQSASPSPSWHRPAAGSCAPGGGPPDPWAEADGRRLPGAGEAPGPDFGAGQEAERLRPLHTPDARGAAAAAGGSGLQAWQQDRLSPPAPSAAAMGAAAPGPPTPSAAAAAAARYCI